MWPRGFRAPRPFLWGGSDFSDSHGPVSVGLVRSCGLFRQKSSRICRKNPVFVGLVRRVGLFRQDWARFCRFGATGRTFPTATAPFLSGWCVVSDFSDRKAPGFVGIIQYLSGWCGAAILPDSLLSSQYSRRRIRPADNGEIRAKALLYAHDARKARRRMAVFGG